MAYIDIKNLTFKYNSKLVSSALDNISFSIEEGDFCLLCGASGSGKTTLLRSLNKLTAPYGNRSGSIQINGTTIDDLDTRDIVSMIGYVSQNPDSQIICEKPLAQMAFTLENLGFDNNIIRRRVAEMSSYFGIENYLDKNTNELSGGQKQLLNLAAVMCTYPNILLLDEPLAMLDPIYAEDFINILHKLNQEMGVTIILCEHNLDMVYSLANKLCVLDKGKLNYYGPTSAGIEYILNNDVAVDVPCCSYIFNKYSISDNNNIPLTIKDGRNWLRTLSTSIHKSISDNESHSFNATSYYEGTSSVAFSLKNVYFKYSKYEPSILNGVTFSGNRGEIITITGSNGVGKSTLLSIISSYNKPLSGKVITDKVGYMPQDPSLIFSEKSVKEELEKANRNQKTDMLVNSLPSIKRILDNELINPLDLSGGQKQLLAFYKLAAANVDVLILDEPVKGLDCIAKQELAIALKTFAHSGMCILMVTHDLDFAAMISTKISMMFKGDIITNDAPNVFFLSNQFYTTNLRKLGRGIIDELY